MDFGKNLQHLRIERGIFQKELAAELHVSVETLSNYEEGVSSPDMEMLCRIADYFQVSADYLLGRAQ